MYEELTFGELKEMLPSTKGKEAPTLKKLEQEKILIMKDVDDAVITIYRNGFLSYVKTSGDDEMYSTVFAVDRCSKYVYETVCSEAERNDPGDTSILADEYEVKKLGKACTRKNTVSESHLSGLPWFFPILLHCEDRMVRNQQEREEYHCVPLNTIANGEESGKLYPASAPDCCTLLLEKEARLEARKRFEKLRAAFAILTKRQAEVIKLLYFSNQKLTEREVAKMLGLNQSTVHRTACAALRKLRKIF